MLPVGDDLQSQPWRPIATNGLVVLLVAVFAYTQLEMSPAQREDFLRAYGLVPRGLLGDPLGTWPLLLSHLFLHGSLLHVLGNALFLWVFGRGLEAELRWFFLPAFLALGALAGLGSALLRPEAAIPSIGASGAISGLLGAYLVLFPEASIRVLPLLPWTVLPVFFGHAPLTFSIPAWVFLPAWLALQIFGGLGDVLSPGGVDYGAHLAGFLGGYGLVRLGRGVFGLWPDRHARHLGWDPLLQPASTRKGPYLAARRLLTAGQVLAAEDILVVDQPRGNVDPDAIPVKDRASVLGRRLRVNRYRYEPLLREDLSNE